MDSHYIPYFTRENGRKREAVCGVWCLPSQHSNEPTCADCARWLQQYNEDTSPDEQTFGTEETER